MSYRITASKITEYKFQPVDALTAQTSAGKVIAALTQDVADSNQAYQVIVGDA